MNTVQDIIHRFEVGEGRRYIPIAAGILLFVAVLAIYNLREASGFASVEAMDQSQLARNISQGEGFSTNFIRPLSMALLAEQSKDEIDDPMRLKTAHPDLANAPLYPYLLAVVMKVFPFRDEIPSIRSKSFRRYQPEILIGLVNQGFFIACAFLTFLLARRMFDDAVAWLSVIVLLGSDLLWRFSFSGLSTNMAMLITLTIVILLARLERGHPRQDYEEAEDDERRERSPAYYGLVAGLVGLLLGALMLTRYSLGWLVVPTLLFYLFFLPGRRLVCLGITLVVGLVVVSPWLWRNQQLSGNFFGTAGYAAYHETSQFPRNELERHLQADFGSPSLRDGIRKLLRNSAEIAENQIPFIGGSWLSCLFLAGLLVPFTNKSLNRMRIFVVLAIVVLAIIQAVSRSYLSDYSPVINSQNLLVVLTPLVFIFGVGLFFLLLDQLNLNFAGAQFYMCLLVGGLACLTLLFRVLPPRESPVAYPPYSPPLIQRVGSWFESDELLMSDMPWAVGWYGDKKCLWLTRNLEPDFYTINDQHKPINGLYLTPITTDGKFVSEMIRSSSWAWGRLHMDITLRKNLPKGFPLLHVDDGFMPDQLILTDWPRWNSGGQ